MASRKVLLVAAAAMTVVVGALLPSTASGVSYDVGDGVWGLKEDYADWVRGNSFQVGDTLVFKYEAGDHDVVIVDEDGYKNCDTSDGEELDTGNDSVYLDTAKTYYFICGMEGHCRSGMRLRVEVYAAPDG